jgi:hypothetical protein
LTHFLPINQLLPPLYSVLVDSLTPAAALVCYDNTVLLDPPWPSRYQQTWNWLAAMGMPPSGKHGASSNYDSIQYF